MDRQKIFSTYAPLCMEAYQPGNRDTFCVGNDSGFIVRDGSQMTVAVAGTNDLQDWLDSSNGNLHIGTVRFVDGVDMHRGMHAAAMAIAKVIGDEVRAFASKPGAEIVFTGHSRGGAIAQILPLILNLPLHLVSVVTFASPSVFCGENAYTIGLRCLHFQNGTDLVHRLPVPMGSIKYRHIGTVVRRRIGGDVVEFRATGDTLLKHAFRIILIFAIGLFILRSRTTGWIPASVVKRIVLFLEEAHSLGGGYSESKWYHSVMEAAK